MSSGADARLSITACIVARDEEDRIGDAIRSLSFAAEIVLVLDKRSTDRTAEVAAEAAAAGQALRVVEHEWRGHIAQKNRALELAENDWVFCLDADERVTDELAVEIRALFERGGGAPARSGYTVPRRTYYLGRWIRHGGWYPDRKLRLFRRDHGRWGGHDPHDHVELDGRSGRLEFALDHHSYESVRDHIEKMRSYTSIAARGMRERGVRRPFARMLIHAPAKLLRAYVLKRGFRDGFPGLVVAALGAFAVFLKYAKLWEIYRAEKRARVTGAIPVEDQRQWSLPPPD